MAESAGYNPYRKANGEFASKEEVGSVEDKVSSDLQAAQSAGDSGEVARIESYAMEKMPESKLGQELLESRYGSTPTAQKPFELERSYEEFRESMSGAPVHSPEAISALGRRFESLGDDELSQLDRHASAQQAALRPGMIWDLSISQAVATEQNRRLHGETFKAMAQFGYEHDGQGTYSKIDGGEEAPKFFVPYRGVYRGELMVREVRKARVVSSEEALELAENGTPRPEPRIPDHGVIRAVLKDKKVEYPLNWDELGSSAKDIWEINRFLMLRRSGALD